MDADHQTTTLTLVSDLVKEGEVLFPMVMPPEKYLWCKLHVPKPEFQSTTAPTEEELREWEEE